MHLVMTIIETEILLSWRLYLRQIKLEVNLLKHQPLGIERQTVVLTSLFCQSEQGNPLLVTSEACKRKRTQTTPLNCSASTQRWLEPPQEAQPPRASTRTSTTTCKSQPYTLTARVVPSRKASLPRNLKKKTSPSCLLKIIELV